jgi:transcriptional regulator with XRE-family HTH domain
MATDTIGQRAVHAIRERIKKNRTTQEHECKKMGISYRVFYGWEKQGTNPSAYYLQQMALAGYDVIWILTGGKED